MIVSCSRRTDIPAFYSDWLMARLRAGTVCVANPYNSHQVSRIELTPDLVDCLVFWTKDPRPMLQHLDEVTSLGYHYYFQLTITPYSSDLEPGIPHKDEIIDAFIELSLKIGKEKVILRYDPIVMSDKYTVAYHKKAFERLCDKVGPYTDKVVISFVDIYGKNNKNLKQAGARQPNQSEMIEIATSIKEIADTYDLELVSCAEAVDLEPLGIKHGQCIDGALIEKITGYRLLNKEKKAGQRHHCACMPSVDIGHYDTCVHGCIYCYGTSNFDKAKMNFENHDPRSEILVGQINEEEVRHKKDLKSFKVEEAYQQMDLFKEIE